MKWHIGCSGFHYREWKDVFYPPKLPQRKWFDHYSSQFDTLELNVTFYRFPQLSFLENWYKISPEHFSFAVKSPRLITHYKQFNDCETLLEDFYTTCKKGLAEKLGAILFQMGPKFSYTAERLELVIQNMRSGFKNVVEFRHNSWWTDDVFNKLKEHGIIFCGMSHPTLPGYAIVNNETAYYRFHGVPKLYYSEYKIETLQKVADDLKKNKQLKEAYIYFNNTAGMGAINNAIWIRNYLGNK